MCDKTPPASLNLTASAEAPGRARAFADSELCRHHAAEADAAVRLMASELVTDAVVRGAAPVEVALECRVSDYVVAVTGGSTAAAVPAYDDEQEAWLTATPQRELSMLLVEKVARSWGVEPLPEGRLCWCTVPTGTLLRSTSRRAAGVVSRPLLS